MRKLEGEEKEEARARANKRINEWNRTNREQIAIRLPIGYRDKLNTIAERQGVSTAALIKTYIDENWVE